MRKGRQAFVFLRTYGIACLVDSQRIGGELEADLVIALAGGAMGDSIGADLVRDLDLPFGDQRPRDRGPKQIDAFIERVGPEHREDVVAHKLFAQVFDIELRCARGFRLFLEAAEFLALPNVGCVGGSWLTPADTLGRGDWTMVEQLARAAATLRT